MNINVHERVEVEPKAFVRWNHWGPSSVNKSLDPIFPWIRVWRWWWVFFRQAYRSPALVVWGGRRPRRLVAKWQNWTGPSSCSSWHVLTGGFWRRAPWLVGAIYAPFPAPEREILVTKKNFKLQYKHRSCNCSSYRTSRQDNYLHCTKTFRLIGKTYNFRTKRSRTRTYTHSSN